MANYLATQLPQQMAVNDANHELVVENQLSRLGATLRSVADAGAIGAEVTQPISLGSLGTPPFAGPDGSQITRSAQGSAFDTSFTVTSGTTSLPLTPSTTSGGSLLVELRNTYSPVAIAAFDLGAVVFAQDNALPVMIVPPGVSFANGALTLWIPQFIGGYGTEVGTGTAELGARLVSLFNVSMPSGGFALSGRTSVAVTTPFAAAWLADLDGLPALAGDVACAPATSVACTGPFEFNGPLATVYVNVTATSLALQLATFSLTMS